MSSELLVRVGRIVELGSHGQIDVLPRLPMRFTLIFFRMIESAELEHLKNDDDEEGTEDDAGEGANVSNKLLS